MLRFQKALFEIRGYKVLTAASARQGLRIAAACAVGHEVAIEIKRVKPQIPIGMVSSDDAIPKLALNVVDAFVSKNEAPHRLLQVTTRICGESLSGCQETRIAT
jgi:hypothetical protein